MEKFLKSVIKKGVATPAEKATIEKYADEYGISMNKRCKNCYVDTCVLLLNAYKKQNVKQHEHELREPFASQGFYVNGVYYSQGTLTKEKYDYLCSIGQKRLFIK